MPISPSKRMIGIPLSSRAKDLYNVPRFLNRVLALDVDHQNALFDHFVDLFDQTVRYAKANGTFDEGVADIKALAIRIAKPPRVVHTDEITNAQTTHYTLEIDVPSKAVSFGEAERVKLRLRTYKRGRCWCQWRRLDYPLLSSSSCHDLATPVLAARSETCF